jgi:hypothetical protein
MSIVSIFYEVILPAYIYIFTWLCHYSTQGPITWKTFNLGVELSPVNRVEFFCDYMDDFNPGVETLHYMFSASIPGSKKALILFSCNK